MSYATAKEWPDITLLAAGAIAHTEALGRVRRNMPDPVPVMVLGRLAVDRMFHGMGIGTGLLRDAILRTLQEQRKSPESGAILVHALSANAKHSTRSMDLPARR